MTDVLYHGYMLHQAYEGAYNHELVRGYLEKHPRACEKDIARSLKMSRRCAGEHKRAVLIEMKRWG